MDTGLYLSRRGLFRAIASLCILPFFPAKLVKETFTQKLVRIMKDIMRRNQYRGYHCAGALELRDKLKNLYISPGALNEIRGWDTFTYKE